jgi:hypothetical protein
MVGLAIVGGGRGHKNALVSGLPIWTVQGVYPSLGRAERIYRLHEHEKDFPDVKGCEIIEWDSIPVDRLREMFGDYFHSSIAWMYAHAIDEGYNDIAFFGIDMLHESEYGYQRGGLYRMIGIAETMGIRTHIPNWSGMYLSKSLYEYRGE